MKKIILYLKIIKFYFPDAKKFYRFIKFRKLIIKNGGFNPSYYLDTYTDINSSIISPLWHYYETGWKEGRNPSASFNTNLYLNSYTDVTKAKINPLHHYILHGKNEGRSISKDQNTATVFSSEYNDKARTSTDQENIDALRNGGIFDEEFYLTTYPEIKEKGLDPVAHYYYHGHKEGKAPCANFSFAYYSN